MVGVEFIRGNRVGVFSNKTFRYLRYAPWLPCLGRCPYCCGAAGRVIEPSSLAFAKKRVPFVTLPSDLLRRSENWPATRLSL